MYRSALAFCAGPQTWQLATCLDRPGLDMILLHPPPSCLHPLSSILSSIFLAHLLSSLLHHISLFSLPFDWHLQPHAIRLHYPPTFNRRIASLHTSSAVTQRAHSRTRQKNDSSTQLNHIEHSTIPLLITRTKEQTWPPISSCLRCPANRHSRATSSQSALFYTCAPHPTSPWARASLPPHRPPTTSRPSPCHPRPRTSPTTLASCDPSTCPLSSGPTTSSRPHGPLGLLATMTTSPPALFPSAASATASSTALVSVFPEGVLARTAKLSPAA
jgi:hypothetical protein